MAQSKVHERKHIPGSDVFGKDVFDFPFIIYDESVEFIKGHGKIMFIIRGPPGTGKNTLTNDLLLDIYPSGVKCSADSYFDRKFVSKSRNPETLKLSHDFCQKRVVEECENCTSPIIVQNTHMKKRELKIYVDDAAKYGYTVIMVITLRKFKVTPEVLEKTNQKGLTKDYFQRRLKQWEEYIPLYLGWFLGPADTNFLLNKGKEALASIIGDGQFCTVYNVFCEEEVLHLYEIKKCLFCIASYCNNGQPYEKKKFYVSNEVQDVYGKCFSLTVEGFVVSKFWVLAMVTIDSEMDKLRLKEPSRAQEDSSEDLCTAFRCMKVKESSGTKGSGCTFEMDFNSDCKTAVLIDRAKRDEIDVSCMSLIILGQNMQYAELDIPDAQQMVNSIFSSVACSQGKIPAHEFSVLDDETRYIRLPDDMWFIQLPQKIVVDSVFTGLYI